MVSRFPCSSGVLNGRICLSDGGAVRKGECHGVTCCRYWCSCSRKRELPCARAGKEAKTKTTENMVYIQNTSKVGREISRDQWKSRCYGEGRNTVCTEVFLLSMSTSVISCQFAHLQAVQRKFSFGRSWIFQRKTASCITGTFGSYRSEGRWFPSNECGQNS